jgi:1,4-dihydroxy-2-naphthoyl-CoA synthase
MVVAHLDQALTQPQLPVESELIIEEKGVGRFVTLNRPRVLNCINLSMLQALAEAYERWEGDDSVGFIVLKGAGRVFCAGGDLKMFYGLGKSDESWKVMVYVKYWLDYHIATFKKPLVALWHGLVMGGGAGLTVAGTFGVATEKTVGPHDCVLFFLSLPRNSIIGCKSLFCVFWHLDPSNLCRFLQCPKQR